MADNKFGEPQEFGCCALIGFLLCPLVFIALYAAYRLGKCLGIEDEAPDRFDLNV